MHEWLGVSLENSLGLTPSQWQQWQQSLDEKQTKLLSLKQQGVDDAKAAKILGLTSTQFQKQWTKLLEQAWEIRNL